LIKNGKTPKGNIVDAATVSAMMAAKRTSDLIPYCHPIPIDDIKVNVTIGKESVKVITQVKSIWKTGVEMESLTSAAVAALTIYDMLKSVDQSISIGPIRVIKKEGGLKQMYQIQGRKLRAAVLVTSDSRRKRQDRSGRLLVDRLKKEGFELTYYKVVADEIGLIKTELTRLCDEWKVDLILTSGGTGIGSRDVTPDATSSILEKSLVGVPEILRAHGQRRTPSSMLSRAVAGVRAKTIIVNLPGSAKAVSESLDSLFPGINHIFDVLENHKHS
jgi:molybdenum cofactor biosynthesis protein MoaC